MIEIVSSIAACKDWVGRARNETRSIGFVPTMGALHEGHLQLMRRAKEENTLLIVSIFVNPIQFNNPEDLKKYPRMFDADVELLKSVGCDLVFAPSESEMYPEQVDDQYDFGKLAEVMEGASRPGHFNGVAIVVRKLFEIITPDKAYFGEKDFQQLAIIKQLVRMLKMPLEVVPCPIVRESDGLAMSSRNMRLSATERFQAPIVQQLLAKAVARKNVLSPDEMKNWVLTEFSKHPECKIDYVEIAEDQYLQPIKHWNDARGVLIFVAVFLGKVRLIDNLRIF